MLSPMHFIRNFDFKIFIGIFRVQGVHFMAFCRKGTGEMVHGKLTAAFKRRPRRRINCKTYFQRISFSGPGLCRNSNAAMWDQDTIVNFLRLSHAAIGLSCKRDYTTKKISSSCPRNLALQNFQQSNRINFHIRSDT